MSNEDAKWFISGLESLAASKGFLGFCQFLEAINRDDIRQEFAEMLSGYSTSWNAEQKING